MHRDRNDLSREELLADLLVLEQENQMLMARAEEFLLLKNIGSILDQDISRTELIQNALELIAVTLAFDICVYGRQLGDTFNIESYYTSRSEYDALSMILNKEEFDQLHGPPARIIADMSELPGLVPVLPPSAQGLIIPGDTTDLFLFVALESSSRQSDHLSLLNEVVHKILAYLEKNALESELQRINAHLSERVQEQVEAIRESEKRFRMVIEQSPHAVEIYRSDGLLVSVNSAFSALWDVHADEYVGSFNILHSDDLRWQKVQDYVRKALRGHSAIIPEYFIKTKVSEGSQTEGDRRWLSTRIYPLKRLDGQVRNVVVTHEDVTYRKLAEEQLFESEARYRGLYESSVDGICTLDAQGNYLNCNHAAEEIMGCKKAELLTRNVSEFVHPDDRDLSRSFLDRLKTEGFYKGYEGRVIAGDGTIKTVEVSSIGIFHEGELVGSHDILRDVSERKHQEAERIELQRKLNQSQKLESLGTMVGGISHELNNVLQSMFLYATLLQEQLPPETELQESLKSLLDEGNRARDIVKQVLSFSRENQSQLEPQKLHLIIDKALAFQKVSLPVNIALQVELDETCPPVRCDSTQIHQIITNLCNNARDAMRVNGGTLEIRLSFYPDSVECPIELKVCDTGEGISPELQERIFDPFFTTKRIGEGTGLGLSVVHGIVTSMGGRIHAESDPGKGSCFTLRFPASDGKIQPQPVLHATGELGHIKRLMLVDDELGIRRATAAILVRRGLDVVTCADGVEALKILTEEKQTFDLIITDLTMPEISGIDLVKRIREFDTQTLIMLSSGNLGIEERSHSQDLGIDGYIQKPWSSEQLMQKLSEVSHRRKA